MSKQVQLRRGTRADISSFIGAVGEVVVGWDASGGTPSKYTLVVQDGVTAGGYPLARENNPTFTGNVTMSTNGSYLQFADGTKQYTANPQVFYMILPGTLYTPLTGTSRWYPTGSVTINTIYYNFSTTSTSDVSVDILVNGNVVNTFTITAGVYYGNTSTSIAVTAGSYVTLNINSGNGSDLSFKFAYT
jgi:hypothetical protein